MNARRILQTGWAGALALLCALQLLALWRAPAAWYPAAIQVTLGRGASVDLGRDQLAAPRAAPAHLRIEHALDGQWSAAALSQATPVVIQRGGSEARTGTVVPGPGMRFALGASRFAVSAAGPHGLSFKGGDQEWTFDGGTLYRNGHAQPACPDTALAHRLAALWNRVMPVAVNVRRTLAFGGNLHCGTRIGIGHVEPGAATLALAPQGFVLAASPASATPLVVERGYGTASNAVLDAAAGAASGAAQRAASRDEHPQHDAARAWLPARTADSLSGADALLAGQTRFALHMDGDTLTLTPSRHVALYPDTRAALPPNVQWDWRARSLWSLPQGRPWLVGAALALLTCTLAATAFQRGRWPFGRGASLRQRGGALATVLLALGGLMALLFQRAGTPPGAGVSLLLGWSALWCALLLFGRTRLVMAAGVILLAIGMLAQLELGLGGADIAWMRHFQKTCALLALGIGVFGHLALRLTTQAVRIPQVTLEWILAALAGTALCALVLQVMFGDETGVFDLQPVEFAKLALTALTAHCIAVGLGWQQDPHAKGRQDALRWLRLAGPVLLFIALLGVALVQVDDYSPLMLLLVWSTVTAFVWAIAARRWLLTVPIVLAAGGACAAIVLLREAGPAALSGLSFYGDRFQVWLDPATHPHTGEQVLLGARAIAEGAWFGSDHWLGTASLGLPAGDAMRIPAVQDDFAPAFFLNRHGLAGALALWTIQALFLGGLLQCAAQAWASARAARDFHGAWLGRFRCFALCGGAAFVLGHFLLSWGTNLAIFPVMGQPMSFLSAGGSHLLFFICPLLALGAISAQTSEEISSCRSMSNTRY